MSESDLDGVRLHNARRVQSGDTQWVSEPLTVEKPLYFVIDRKPLMATMRTPGDDADLVCGYLVTEGIIQHRDQVISVRPKTGERSDTICVDLRGVEPKALESLRRVGASVSSCGICGRKGQDAFTPRLLRPVQPLEVELEAIPDMMARLRRLQPIFEATGGIHAAALFDGTDDPLCVKEDIGRHNAIDKAAGWLLRHDRLHAGPMALVSSGRASFEVVQKAAMAGIGTVICVSAASSLAVDVARDLGLVLIGFVRRDKAVIYWWPDSAPPTP
jgi:FdhD protein